MKAVRLGGAIGGMATLGLLLAFARIPPFDFVVLLLFAIFLMVGGTLGAACVLAWQNIRQTPSLVLRVGGLLALLSLLLLASPSMEWQSARIFLASADSAQGVVTRRYVRGGVHFFVSYETDSAAYDVRATAKRSQLHLLEGDSVTIYFDPQRPWAGEMGRPGPDWATKGKQVAVVWALGGIILSGYAPKAVHWATSYQKGRWSVS